MKQSVIITRLADRHKDLHGRDFAETWEFVVEANPLAYVLEDAAKQIDLGTGRYTISISEPYD